MVPVPATVAEPVVALTMVAPLFACKSTPSLLLVLLLVRLLHPRGLAFIAHGRHGRHVFVLVPGRLAARQSPEADQRQCRDECEAFHGKLLEKRVEKARSSDHWPHSI